MSAIRLLILGVLGQKGPRHGYDIRRELEVWRAEQWANISYGSIYFALNKMTGEGLLKIISKPPADEKGPQRMTVYEITEAGKTEFLNLLRKQWWDFKPVIDPFQVALTFMDQLKKDELVRALEHRAEMLKTHCQNWQQLLEQRKEIDDQKHISENFRLALEHCRTELQWVEAILNKVQKNELP